MTGVSTPEVEAARAMLQRQGTALVLERAAGRLQLRDTRPGAPGAIYADFTSAAAESRRRAGRGLLLAKAIGIKKGVLPQVLDATAGLGRDTYALAALGCEVTAIERNAVVAVLLADAIDRAGGDAAVRRIALHTGDARDLMAVERFEVVYLDPMFPERRKTALARKEMQYMQALLSDDDGASLLAPALVCATRRVVVKRPLHAAPLQDSPKPTHSHKGKAVRFDVYARG